MPILGSRGGGSARGFGRFGGPAAILVDYLVVAGGGGGGGTHGGGGGGGGLKTGTAVTLQLNTDYTVTVGAGGIGGFGGLDGTNSQPGYSGGSIDQMEHKVEILLYLEQDLLQ